MTAHSTAPLGVHVDTHADGYFTHTRPEIRRLIPSAARRLLDVGCGEGLLAREFVREHAGRSACGLEGQPDAAAKARQHLDHVACLDLDTMTKLPSEFGRFDVITCGDVLEHLLDPERILRVLAGALTPDGCIVVSVPNLQHWSVVLRAVAHDQWPREESGLLDSTHVHMFTADECAEMAERVGLQVAAVEVTDHHPIQVPVRPFVDALGQATGDRDEAYARVSAYQLLMVLEPAASAAQPAPTMSARQLDPGLDACVPSGYVRRSIVEHVTYDAVLDAVACAKATMPAPSTPATALVANGVVAHLLHPEKVFHAWASALRERDVLVLSARNVTCADTIGPLILDGTWTYGHGALSGHPVRFWTQHELTHALLSTGLRLVDVHHEKVPLDPAYEGVLRAAQPYAPGDTVRENLERGWMRVVARRG